MAKKLKPTDTTNKVVKKNEYKVKANVERNLDNMAVLYGPPKLEAISFSCNDCKHSWKSKKTIEKRRCPKCGSINVSGSERIIERIRIKKN